MDIYGERYAPVSLFISYCKDLNVQTDERELEYYERTGVMLPVARMILPDNYVVEAYRRELDNDYDWNGFDEWPALADLTEKFRPTLSSYGDLTDEERVHCFDRAIDVGGNPYLNIPTYGDYTPWGEYAVPFADAEDLERPTAEHYYSHWQVHQLYSIQRHPHLHRYAGLVDRLPPDDPVRTSLLTSPPKEHLRDFDGMRPRFDALSFWITLYGRERGRTFASVPDQNGVRKIDAATEYNHKQRLAALASEAIGRYQLSAQNLYQFLHQLIALYEDYDRNERFKLARKLRYDILHCGRLLELAENRTWQEVTDRLRKLDPFDKQTFRRLLPAAKERDYAVDMLTHAPSTWSHVLQKSGEPGWPFTDPDANALLDFCEKAGLSLLRTSLSGFSAIGEEEWLEKFARTQSYNSIRNTLTGYEGLLKALAPKPWLDKVPNRLTPTVRAVMQHDSQHWLKEFDNFLDSHPRFLNSESTEAFLEHLSTLLSDYRLQGSAEGSRAAAFLVTCLARNFTAHSYPDEDTFSVEALGKMADAVIVAITYTWKLAQSEGWLNTAQEG